MAKADLERARQLYPSCDELGYDGWMEFFNTREGFAAMGQMIYDIYDEVLAQIERDAGRRQMGRRPAREAVSLDEVFALVFPQPYTMDPFPEAMQKLLAGQSQRAFSRKIPCDQATLSRLMNGQHPPDISMLERIATAARVAPYYFVEWRALFMGRMVTRVFLEKPNVSVSAYEMLSKMRGRFAG